MTVTVVGMSKKKPTSKAAIPTTFKFRADLRAALERYIASHSTSNITHEIHEALRERLERLGYWPPKE